MPVEPIGSVEREEAGHADDDRAKDLVPDIEVIVREAALLVGEDAIVGVLGGILWHGDPKCPALLHAFKDEIDAVSIPLLHPAQSGQHVVFLADSLASPLNRELMVAGVRLHPALVVVGASAQHFFVHHRKAEHLPEEEDHLLRPRQATEVTVDDDAVETVVYKNQQAAKQLCESLHRSSSILRSRLDNRE